MIHNSGYIRSSLSLESLAFHPSCILLLYIFPDFGPVSTTTMPSLSNSAFLSYMFYPKSEPHIQSSPPQQMDLMDKLILAASTLAKLFIYATLFLLAVICAASAFLGLLLIIYQLYMRVRNWWRAHRARIGNRLGKISQSLSSNKHITMPANPAIAETRV